MLTQHHINTVKTMLAPAVQLGQMSKEDIDEIIFHLGKQINTPKPIPEEVWKLTEACKFLKVSKPTLLSVCRKKEIPLTRIGATLRITKSNALRIGGLN